MMIRLCQTGLHRLGPDGSRLVAALRDLNHSPVSVLCLDRCQGCERAVVASADGLALQAPSVDDLLAQVEALSDEDEF